MKAGASSTAMAVAIGPWQIQRADEAEAFEDAAGCTSYAARRPASEPRSNTRTERLNGSLASTRLAVEAGKEHGADRHVVCTVEPVNGAAAVDGGRGMSASARRDSGSQGREYGGAAQ